MNFNVFNGRLWGTNYARLALGYVLIGSALVMGLGVAVAAMGAV